jgi:alkylhydroperoxidase family enzyme
MEERVFGYLDQDTAPAASLPLIERSIKAYTFLPKLHAILANAPATYQAYLDTFALFEHNTSLSPLEQQVVFQTANHENACHYCLPGHTFLMQAAGMPQDVIAALRTGAVLADGKLEALHVFARRLIQQRGHLSAPELQEFFAAGYTQRSALEVLVGLAAKLMSNYTNALANTDLDDPVKPYAWKP